VSEEEELAGLDISTHGMYGYPEAFIPQEEYGAVGAYQPNVAGTPIASPSDNRPSTPAASPTATSV
jgi:Amt family ammonium transporter